jgi:hypothetical protein
MGGRSVAMMAVLLLTAACGTSSGQEHPAASRSPKLPSVIDPAGTVLVTSREDIRYTPDLKSCVTRGAAADIHLGTRVEIRTNQGHWTAAGPLGPGYFRDGGAEPAGCAFDFAMTHAPGGSPSYRVRVAKRPAQFVEGVDITRVMLQVS